MKPKQVLEFNQVISRLPSWLTWTRHRELGQGERKGIRKLFCHPRVIESVSLTDVVCEMDCSEAIQVFGCLNGNVWLKSQAGWNCSRLGIHVSSVHFDSVVNSILVSTLGHATTPGQVCLYQIGSQLELNRLGTWKAPNDKPVWSSAFRKETIAFGSRGLVVISPILGSPRYIKLVDKKTDVLCQTFGFRDDILMNGLRNGRVFRIDNRTQPESVLDLEEPINEIKWMDDFTLVTGSMRGLVKLWDSRFLSRPLVTLDIPNERLRFSFDTQDQWISVCCDDGKLRIWNRMGQLVTEQAHHEPHQGFVQCQFVRGDASKLWTTERSEIKQWSFY